MADGCFKYNLDNMETKVLTGRFGLVAQVHIQDFVVCHVGN